MNTKNVNHFAWFSMGMAVCLAASLCVTSRDTQTNADGTPPSPALQDDVVPILVVEKGAGARVSLSPARQDGGVSRPAVSDSKSTDSQIVERKLRSIIIPEMKFSSPATIIDAVDFFRQASRDYDDQEIPFDERGVNFILKLPEPLEGEIFANIPIFRKSVRNISLYDAVRLICKVTNMRLRITGNIVRIVPLGTIEEDELVTRTYRVLHSIMERIYKVGSEHSEKAPGGVSSQQSDTSEPTVEDAFKLFCGRMGVKWPVGSSVSYTPGKLRVTNTDDNLAIMEQIFLEISVSDAQLIRIDN